MQKLGTFDVSLLTLDANFDEFRALVEYLASEKAMDRLGSLKDRDSLHLALMHVARRLHNFVAAVKTLIDHTRKVKMDLNQGERTIPDFDQELNAQITSDPLCKFVQDLRTICHHEALPSIAHNTNITLNPETGQQIVTHTVTFVKTELMASDRWSAPARRFLKLQPEQIDILPIVRAYRDKALAFTVWFRDRERQTYAKELNELHQKQSEYAILEVEAEVNAALAGGFPPGLDKTFVFHAIFNSQDYAELDATPPDSPERAAAALRLLQQHCEPYAPITEELGNKIVDLFTRHVTCHIIVKCETCEEILFEWRGVGDDEYVAKIEEAQALKSRESQEAHCGHQLHLVGNTRATHQSS